jgi:uncharacterized protein YaaQ
MEPPDKVDVLVILVASGLQAPQLMDHLSKEKFNFTKLDSFGGVIQESTICLLLGINQARMRSLLDLVNEYCQPVSQYIPAHMVNAPPEYLSMAMVEAKVGGAVLYSMNVERFEQF